MSDIPPEPYNDLARPRILSKVTFLKHLALEVWVSIVGLKAGESFDTIMSTCDGVGHITGHWKINKT